MADESVASLEPHMGEFTVAAEMLKRITRHLDGPNVSPAQLDKIKSALHQVQGRLSAGFAEIEAALEQEREARAFAERARSQPLEVEGQRRSFLLRLLASSIEDLVKSGELPRETLLGIDEYVEKQIGHQLYDNLNAEAKSLYESLAKDAEGKVGFADVMAFQPTKRLMIIMFYRICLRFVSFDRAYITMTTIIQNQIGKSQKFERDQFKTVLTRLLSPLRDEIATEQGKEYVEFMLGPVATGIIEEVSVQFEAWTRDV